LSDPSWLGIRASSSRRICRQEKRREKANHPLSLQRHPTSTSFFSLLVSQSVLDATPDGIILVSFGTSLSLGKRREKERKRDSKKKRTSF
jgi:hypothetical protein